MRCIDRAGATQSRQNLSRYRHVDADIRGERALADVFSRYGRNIAVVIHTAAQPSHDWAPREPLTDSSINASLALRQSQFSIFTNSR